MFMKKVGKGLLVLSLGLMLVGSGVGCDNNNNDQPPVTENYDEDKNYEEYSNSLQGIYEESVKSTVVVLGYNQNYENPSMGSGFVFDEVGDYAYILTNAHVLFAKYDSSHALIERPYTHTVEVIHSNYVRVRATVMGYNREEDVAVLKIEKSTNYKVAKIVSDDHKTKLGESVFAIGNPHGNYFAMSEGVISSNRIETSINYVSSKESATTFVFNSTATINSGNSGGALFNSKGEVVAVNSMYPQDSQASGKIYRNYNYSIPVNHCIDVANYIIGNETYSRTYLALEGVSISSLTVSQRTQKGITVTNGVYVTNSNVTGIPSDQKVILEVGGIPVNTMDDIEYVLFTKYANANSVEIKIVDKTGINPGPLTVSLSKR